MLYGQHPFGNCKSIPELKNQISDQSIEIPPSNTRNRDVSLQCISLLKKLLQKDANERITWNDFFDNPWVNAYQYVNFNNKKNDEYEKQLFSTSLGSITSISKDDHNLSSTPKIVKFDDSFSNNNTPIIKMSHLENLVVVEDFCDKIEDSYGNKITNNKEESHPIFEMDEDVL